MAVVFANNDLRKFGVPVKDIDAVTFLFIENPPLPPFAKVGIIGFE